MGSPRTGEPDCVCVCVWGGGAKNNSPRDEHAGEKTLDCTVLIRPHSEFTAFFAL